MSKRHAFSKLVNQGYQVQLLHSIGKAAIAHCKDPHVLSKWYAAKHGQHHGEGTTPAAAIAAVRAARAEWQASEKEVLTIEQFKAAGITDLDQFATFNGLRLDIAQYNRATLRRIVTHPARKAINRATYGDQLRNLGIHLSKPKQQG